METICYLHLSFWLFTVVLAWCLLSTTEADLKFYVVTFFLCFFWPPVLALILFWMLNDKTQPTNQNENTETLHSNP